MGLDKVAVLPLSLFRRFSKLTWKLIQFGLAEDKPTKVIIFACILIYFLKYCKIKLLVTNKFYRITYETNDEFWFRLTTSRFLFHLDL